MTILKVTVSDVLRGSYWGRDEDVTIVLLYDCTELESLISPSSQWKEYICPVCDYLMDDPIQTSCGHRMCYKCFDQSR